MEEIVQVKDRRFAVSIPASTIRREVCRVAEEINRDYAGKTPLFLVVLNGSFMFAADLLREVIGLGTDITNRQVIVVEDIVDTGLTMAYMLDTLQKHNPQSIDVCTLLLKPEKLQVKLDIRYRAMEIPNDFIVGYGLEYDGFGRNLKDIYSIIAE